MQIRDLTETTVEKWGRRSRQKRTGGETVKEQTRSGLKRLLEGAMEGELLEQLSAGWYRRTESRRGYRNGYRYRGLLTELGMVEHLRVPRDRDGAYQTKVLCLDTSGVKRRSTRRCERCS